MYLAHENPAGGAPLVQVVLTALIALTFLAPTVLVVVAERVGRANPVGRLADRLASRVSLPRWVALPSLTLFASLLSAGVGVYWDVPYHVDFGRDEGPLANPAHYLILFGLLGVFSSGLLSCGLATDPLPRRTLPLWLGHVPGVRRLPRAERVGWPDWRAPLGGVIVTVSGGFGLLGFPLDDLWHRFFGQDVTEWGPTHVLMIGGAVVATLGGAVLVAEARQVQVPSPGRDASRESAPAHRASAPAARALEFHYALWWLLGISAFLMEYDIGVPQFPMVAQVTIVAIASAWPLVWARSAYGPGGAVFAAVAFLAARGVLMLLAGEGLGRSTHHFSLYLGQAVLIELLAVMAGTRRRYRFGVLAGVAAGTAGVVTEWAWTQVFLPLPWPAQQLPGYAGYAVLAGIGAGLIGAWQGSRLDEIATPSGTPSGTGPRHAARRRQYAMLLVGAVLTFGVLGAAVPRTADESLHGTVTLDRAGAGRAYVTVALDDPDAVDDAVWFYALSWQGGGSVRAPMRPAGDGVYRSARPMPVTGDWKTLVRLHRSTNHLVSLPVYLPGDAAIPVAEIPAESGVTRPFGAELHLLQREAKIGLPAAMWYAGYATLFLIYLLLFTLITALYSRASRPASAGGDHEACDPESACRCRTVHDQAEQRRAEVAV